LKADNAPETVMQFVELRMNNPPIFDDPIAGYGQTMQNLSHCAARVWRQVKRCRGEASGWRNPLLEKTAGSKTKWPEPGAQG
jgi:hypothetical protein